MEQIIKAKTFHLEELLIGCGFFSSDLLSPHITMLLHHLSLELWYNKNISGLSLVPSPELLKPLEFPSVNRRNTLLFMKSLF